MTSSSPPTRRVVEIIELLTERAGVPTRLSDIVKALGLNQATVYIIMKELVETGWVKRDPVDKTFSIGSALASLARRIDESPSVGNAAYAVAQTAAAETGYAATVSERTGDQLVISAFIAEPGPGGDQWHAAVGDMLPFAAPFGPVFAAWEPPEERLAWIHRSGVRSPAFRIQVERLLDDTIKQGFSVERTSPEMVSAIPVMSRLQAEALSEKMRDHLGEVMLEMAGASRNPTKSIDRNRDYVGAISAPVFNGIGRVTHNISMHPFTHMSAQKIEQTGHRLRRAVDAIDAATT